MDFGALAQLGERLHGMQEVSGSIPLGSTIAPLFAGVPVIADDSTRIGARGMIAVFTTFCKGAPL